MTLDLFLEH